MAFRANTRSAQVVLILLLSAATATAHPGWGIVQDSRGNVYFTDTKQVWRIAPDGSLSVAVADVHTHELAIDTDDNLYGEHLWYLGDVNQWRHRVWRLASSGTVSDVIPAREGFLNDYSFVRDRGGNMYWADRGTRTTIKKRSPGGSASTHAVADFRSVERMTASPDGTLFLIDAGNLRRISPAGTVTTLVAGLSGKNQPRGNVARLNYHMGLWTDAQQRVYIAAAAERLVLRVEPGGKTIVVAQSVAPWAPAGGFTDREGVLWMLEFDNTNEQRVRRIDRTGNERIFSPVGNIAPEGRSRHRHP